MKILTDINQINKILENFKGDKAQFWLYDITHKKIAIRISINNRDEVIYLVMASCQYIRGIFSWDNPIFYVDKYYNVKEMENIYRLVDKSVDFQLEGSGGIALAKGLENELGDSFEDFFKEK